MSMVFMADAWAGIRPFDYVPVARPAFGKRMGPPTTHTDPSSNVTVYTILCDNDYIEICFVVYTSSNSGVFDINQQNGVLPINNGYMTIDFGNGRSVTGSFSAHYNVPADGDIMLREHTIFVSPLVTPSTN